MGRAWNWRGFSQTAWIGKFEKIRIAFVSSRDPQLVATLIWSLDPNKKAVLKRTAISINHLDIICEGDRQGS